MSKERRVEDVNLLSSKPLVTPAAVQEKIPLTDEVRRNVLAGREQVRAIMDREDRRLFLIVGPCSIHNTEMALGYAARLAADAEEVKATALLVMRVYFEKPRTSVGWKGFITDPALVDSFRIEEGIHEARKLLVRLGEMGLAAATEFVDPIIPQYIADLITWTAIGARTTESQKHREMASGLSTPVGLKNSTYGTLDTAVNGLVSVAGSHRCVGVSRTGEPTICETAGNR